METLREPISSRWEKLELELECTNTLCKARLKINNKDIGVATIDEYHYLVVECPHCHNLTLITRANAPEILDTDLYWYAVDLLL